jgi:leader peptidase (prepilin peptidase) / N-methyltransferase
MFEYIFIVFPIILFAAGLIIGRFLQAISFKLLEHPDLPAPAVSPVFELTTALAYLWIGTRFGANDAEWVAGLVLSSVLIVITYTDLMEMIIPDKAVFTGIAAAIMLRAFVNPMPLWDYASAAVAAFTFLLLVSIVSRGGIGGGDIKLYLFIGLILGIKLTLISLFTASVLAAVYGGIMLIVGRRKQPIPFGPFIAAGSFLAFLYGEQWVNSYLSWLVFGV